MKNNLDENTAFVLEQVLDKKRIKQMDSEKLTMFLASSVLELSSKCDFMESMNNQAGRRADTLTFEFQAMKSRHNELYKEHQKLLLEFEKLKTEAEAEKAIIEDTYKNLVLELKAKLYDDIGFRFSRKKSS